MPLDVGCPADRDEMTYLSFNSLSILILWNMVKYSGNILRLGWERVWLWQSTVRDLTRPYKDTNYPTPNNYL